MENPPSSHLGRTGSGLARAKNKFGAVRVTKKFFAVLARAVMGCPETEQARSLTIELAPRRRDFEKLATIVGVSRSGMPAPRELRATKGRLYSGLLAFLPHERPLKHLTPKFANSSRASAGHFREWTAPRKVVVRVFDHAKRFAHRVRQNDMGLFRFLADVDVRSAQLNTRRDDVVLVAGSVSIKVKVKEVAPAARILIDKSESHLTRCAREQKSGGFPDWWAIE